MVCLGNICRSPLAQGILEELALKNKIPLFVDSCGTGGWHIGNPPDQRSIDIAKQYNIDISQQRARKFNTNDFIDFDKIYVMDTTNFTNVIRLCSNNNEVNKVELILKNINKQKRLSVPDPYYGGQNGFENVFKLLYSACEEIIKNIPKDDER